MSEMAASDSCSASFLTLFLQGSVATYSLCDGMLNILFVTNFLANVTRKIIFKIFQYLMKLQSERLSE